MSQLHLSSALPVFQYNPRTGDPPFSSVLKVNWPSHQHSCCYKCSLNLFVIPYPKLNLYQAKLSWDFSIITATSMIQLTNIYDGTIIFTNNMAPSSSACLKLLIDKRCEVTDTRTSIWLYNWAFGWLHTDTWKDCPILQAGSKKTM